MGQVLHPYFERVSVIQFEVCVNRETQIFLNLLTQFVQQVLNGTKTKAKTDSESCLAKKMFLLFLGKHVYTIVLCVVFAKYYNFLYEP